MNKSIIGWIIGGVVVVGLIIGAIVYASQKQTTNPPASNNTQSKSTNDTSAAASDKVTITYTDNGFNPDSYSIKVGGTVTVENKSSRDLEFSSNNHPVHTDEPELNMSTLKPGETGTFVVNKVGTWGFHDHLRAEATGTLRVL